MNWRRSWIIGVTTFLVLFGGSEMFWRSRGHVPTVQDGRALWASRREAIRTSGSPVALLGASRMHYGFDMATWRERVPEFEPFMLAVDGSSPLPTLHHLAAEESFHGLVVMSVFAELFEPHKQAPQQAYTRFFDRDYHIGAEIENNLTLWIQDRVALMNPALSPLRIAKSLAEHEGLPDPNYLHQTPEREAWADFLSQDPDWLAHHRQWRLESSRRHLEVHPPTPPDAWSSYLEPVADSVDAIESRGGRVAFVCLPATDALWQAKSKAYPRTAYWSQLEARFGHRTIHFLDEPGLANLRCPDMSHVDGEDRERLTSALIEALTARGMLGGGDDRNPDLDGEPPSQEEQAAPAPGGR